MRCRTVLLIGILGCFFLGLGIPNMSKSGPVNEPNRVCLVLGIILTLLCIPSAFLSVRQNPRLLPTLVMAPLVWISGCMAPLFIGVAMSAVVEVSSATKHRLDMWVGFLATLLTVGFLIWGVYQSQQKALQPGEAGPGPA
jgi:hypothetical protein